MDSLKQDYVKKRKIYREIFQKSHDSIKSQLEMLRKNHLCNNCSKNCKIKGITVDILSTFKESCNLRNWQKSAIDKLTTEISKDILEKFNQIIAYREQFNCSCCALCCRFACSEFSYSQLKQKAANGDNFASQFISVFVPYDSVEKAQQIYPEYIELLKTTYGDTSEVYFYYCPKLSKDNLCSDYENRPQICKEFPNNPLAILPNSCGFKQWHDEVEILSLTLNALKEITEFYITKLNSLISDK